MSNINLIIPERAANIGNFLVGRLLPFRQKRMLGPFIFIDHMGPVQLNKREHFDVLPHPHIGLSTLTYLFEGSIMHRDSIGSAVEIKPGAVNWMTAGKGVVHSERTPDYLRKTNQELHGLQIWVALPKEKELIEPSFTHINEDELPTWQDKSIHYKLIAGEAFGKQSPVPVHSKLYMLELKCSNNQEVALGDHLYGEVGLYILKGGIKTENQHFGEKQLLIAKDTKLCSFTMETDSVVYLFGGEAFLEERYIDWNFVSSSKSRIEEAIKKWKAQDFPKIEGKTDFVPYPDKKLFS